MKILALIVLKPLLGLVTVLGMMVVPPRAQMQAVEIQQMKMEAAHAQAMEGKAVELQRARELLRAERAEQADRAEEAIEAEEVGE